jgi:hypothetical protein
MLLFRAMKAHLWDNALGDPGSLSAARPARSKRKTVAQILRAAYRKHVRDADTRRAVKRCLH